MFGPFFYFYKNGHPIVDKKCTPITQHRTRQLFILLKSYLPRWKSDSFGS